MVPSGLRIAKVPAKPATGRPLLTSVSLPGGPSGQAAVETGTPPGAKGKEKANVAGCVGPVVQMYQSLPSALEVAFP